MNKHIKFDISYIILKFVLLINNTISIIMKISLYDRKHEKWGILIMRRYDV